MGLRRRTSAETTLYHVVIKADDQQQDVRSRMGLLNAAMARIVAGADDFHVVMADYDKGCLELDVWTSRLKGIHDGLVSVAVSQVVSA